MPALIWSGVALALIGVALLGRLALIALRMKREKADAAAWQASFGKLMALNFTGLGLGLLGLGLLAAGLLIG